MVDDGYYEGDGKRWLGLVVKVMVDCVMVFDGD